MPAILGRTLTTDNDIRKGPGTENRQVAVISCGFWQRQYGGAADVLGRTVELDRVPFTIIGVTSPEFTGVDQGGAYDVAVPLANEPLIRGVNESAMDPRTWWWIRVMARLKPGASLDNAAAALRGVQPQMREATLPNNYRPKDQLLAESVVLSAVGTLLGLLFARWGARLLVFELSGPRTAGALDVGLDWRVLLFTIAVATATAVLFGIAPAWRATKVAPTEAIKEQGESIAGESRLGFGSMLVVAQVALSLVLIVGAGLFVRTFSSLANVRLGFDPNPILLVDANSQRSAIAQDQRPLLYERMRQAALAVPGVQSVALQTVTPLTSSEWDTLTSTWAATFVASTNLLFGLQPRDPATLLTAALVLGAIGAIAGYLPARRASRIDPARVLREG